MLPETSSAQFPAQLSEIRSVMAGLRRELDEVNGTLALIHVPLPSGIFFFPKLPRHDDPAILLRHQLLLRQEKLTDTLKSHSKLLSPIRYLPPELLQMIFFNCLSTNRVPAFSPCEAPLLLCHVCSWWRHLALDTPELWATISFDVPADPQIGFLLPKSTEKQTQVPVTSSRLACVHLWLNNIPLSPLSFCFTSSGGSSASKLFAAFALQGHRWRCVAIKMPAANFRFSTPMVALQSLRIEFPTTDIVEWEFFDQLSTFTPNLQQLTLLCDGFRFLRHGGSLKPMTAWTLLTRLNIFPTSSAPQYLIQLHDIIDLLRNTPNIIICALYMMYSRVSHPPPVSNVLLSELVSLHISTDQSISYIMDHLDLPKLRDFQLDSGEDLFNWPQAEFASMLARADSSLVRFGVRTKTMQEGELIECLRMMPELRCLDLEVQDGVGTIGDSLLTLLFPSAQKDGCLLPQLNTFVLHVKEKEDRSTMSFSDEKFVDVILQRSKTQLRRLFWCQKELDTRLKKMLDGCKPLQTRIQPVAEEHFTPEISKRNQDTLWRMMSDLGWKIEGICEAYHADF